jgi:hypothetical protein
MPIGRPVQVRVLTTCEGIEYPTVKTFFSPRAYRNGELVAVLACGYLFMTGFWIFSAAQEYMAMSGQTPDDGGYWWFFALLATLPLSLSVIWAWGLLWPLAVFAVCALVNALLFWVLFRGRRVHRVQPDTAEGSDRIKPVRPE